MDKIFAIGDIHGHYERLTELLTKWNPATEQLLFVGDYIDRGPQSLEVLHKVKELHDQHGAIALMGNHEEIFLQWLREPVLYAQHFVNVGGSATIQSFLGSPITTMPSITDIAQKIQIQYPELIEFILTLPYYSTWEDVIFVHAGIDPYTKNFKDTAKHDFLWIRDEFTQFPHMAKERVVFGHTPSLYLHSNGSSDVWLSECGKKIGIDGGVNEALGRLNGIVLTKGSNEMIVHSVMTNNSCTTKIQLPKVQHSVDWT